MNRFRVNSASRTPSFDRYVLALLGLLAANLVVGIVVTLFGIATNLSMPGNLAPSQSLAVMLMYLVLGGIILMFSLSESPTPAGIALAGAVLTIGVNYSNGPLLAASGVATGGVQAGLYVVSALSLDALMMPFLWYFVYQFHGQSSLVVAHASRVFIAGTSLVAVFLIATNLLLRFADVPALNVFERRSEAAYYWLLSFATLPLVYPLLFLKYLRASDQDQPAYRYLFASLLLGVPALIVVIGGSVSESFTLFLKSELGRVLVVNLANVLVLGIPVVMAYSVLMDEDISRQSNRVRFLISAALTRIILVLPVLGGFWSLFALRDTKIGELHSDLATSVLLICVLLFLLARRYEARWERYVKKIFFRDLVDRNQALFEFTEAAGSKDDVNSLLTLLAQTVTRAVGVKELSATVIEPFTQDVTHLVPAGGYVANTQLMASGSVIRLGEPETLIFVGLGEKENGDALDRNDNSFLAKLQLATNQHVGRLRSGPHCPSHALFKPFEVAAECARCGALQERGEAQCQTCFGDLAAAALPKNIGHLNVTRRVGTGAFGKVYEAVDSSLGRYVALKVLPAGLVESNQQEITQEGRVMAAFDHPHLARVFGIDYWRDVPFLVTEIFQDGTLENQVGKLSKDSVLGILRGLMQALQYIHGKGVLHLDIKPSNIALSAEGRVKILDFGTSNLVGAVSRQPSEGTVSDANMRQTMTSKKLNGTPIYMCPEALMGGKPDELFDFWSATVSVLELATGTHPFLRQNWQYSFLAISRGETELGDAARRLLSPKRSERATDPEEIEQLIQELVQALP